MDTFRAIFIEIVKLWNEMALFLLFGFVAAGVLSRIMSAATVASHMGGASWWAITKAALLGIPLPLCSCGVIPTGLWLRDHGASQGATSAFLISTPQTGIDSWLVTYSFLGLVFALARPVAALFSGLLGGLLVSNLVRAGDSPAFSTASDPACPHCVKPNSSDQPHSSHENHHVSTDVSKTSLFTHVIQAARYGLVTIPKEIGLWLFVGVGLAGIAAWLIPDSYFQQHLQSNFLTMLLLIALGIPMYICSSASVPFAAVLAVKGASPGAVLVFLMAGPATNIGSIAILFKLLGVRATIIQTVSIMISALACGLALDWLYNLIYGEQGLSHLQEIVRSSKLVPHVHSTYGLARIVASIVLLLVVLNALRLLWLDKRAKAAACHCH